MRVPALGLLLFSLPLVGAEFTGRVVFVEDGDTIDVLRDGRPEKLRLDGVDCPELGQDYGSRAREHTSALVGGKDVRVIVEGRDAHGRTIARVVLPDGRVLNRELVKAGLAWWYYSFAPKDRDLAKLQADAKAAKVGLWAGPRPMPPWFFRDARSRRMLATPVPSGRRN